MFNLASVKNAWSNSHSRKEVFVYSVVWGLIILSIPTLAVYDALKTDTVVSWSEVGRDVLSLLPFIALFIFNDLFLAQLIVGRRLVLTYILLAVLSAGLMTIAIEFFNQQFMFGCPPTTTWTDDGATRQGPPDVPPDGPHDGPFGKEHFGPGPNSQPHMAFSPDGPMPDGMSPDGPRRLGPRPEWADTVPPPRPDGPHEAGEIGPRPDSMPTLLGRTPLGPMFGNLALALLMMSLGIVVKLFLLSERDNQRLVTLSHERTVAELEQLKYQLSPHFMMNTLNNIHALVDIDAERAKLTIEQMSQLMRNMLYDSSKPLTPLRAEVSFLHNYIELMRIRYTDDVEINVNLPDETYNIMLPPLLFVNMVENAFKHGISYSHKSFVDVQMSISDDLATVNFCCTNSLGSAPQDAQHGIGMVNVRKRLDLLCPGKYEFSTLQLEDRYVSTLKIVVSQ